MSWTVVRFDAVAAQPWRNGGGVTRELLAWPPGGSWIARVSVADIVRDGPFSAFDDVERWFAVLTGAGVLLGEPARSVQRGDEVLRFAGESAPACCLIDGETRDLNLMVRRDAASGWMRRLPPAVAPLHHADLAPAAAALCGVFTVGGGQLTVGTEHVVLPAMSLAWHVGGAAMDAAVFAPGSADAGNFEFGCVIGVAGENKI